jgi:small GTP-binding protein
MIGNSNVGKTALIKTYCARGSLRSSKLATLGVEVEPAWVAIHGQVVKVKVWDTAGQERLATLTKSFIKNLDGVMLVFDITDRQSFDNTLTWYKQIIECSDIPIVFIGNKSDL